LIVCLKGIAGARPSPQSTRYACDSLGNAARQIALAHAPLHPISERPIGDAMIDRPRTARAGFLTTLLAAAPLLAPFASSLAAGAAPNLDALPVTDPNPIDPKTLSWTPYELRTHKPDFKKAKANKLEKVKLRLGMIKLTDCIPIVAAKELGYFAEEGLDVAIEVQPNWKAVNDRVINMELDGSHMLYNHPIGAAIGYGVSAELVCPYNMSINGMGLTVSNAIFEQMAAKDPRLKEWGYAMPVASTPIKNIAAERKAAGQEPLRMYMTFPSGSHNMSLRYWLAAGGVHPGFYDGYSDAVGRRDADVLLTVNPPPLMAQAMQQGTCDAFCVGEPWNMQVTLKDFTGRPICPSQFILDGSPDKVFCVAKEWAENHPNTLTAVLKGLIRAGQWLDESKGNRKRAVEMLAHKDYIGANVEVLAESMLGSYVYAVERDASGALTRVDRRSAPDFNIFYRRHASFPFQSHAVWGLTQARRWGQIPENKSDRWYLDIAAKTYRTDLYRTAFAALMKDGKVKAEDLPADDFQPFPAEASVDRKAFDPKKPNDYLAGFAIGLK
jgi:nitrate/nitrite transport system substrate-binding protein